MICETILTKFYSLNFNIFVNLDNCILNYPTTMNMGST